MITDTVTEIETYLGRILVPEEWGRFGTETSMWTNRIGHKLVTKCTDPESATAFFSEPSGNGGSVRPTGHVNTFEEPSSCPSTRFSEFIGGVRQEVGLVAP